MSLGSTLVSYDSITRPFPDVQSLLATTRNAAGNVIPDSSKADAAVEQVRQGLIEMQDAQGKYPN